MAVIAGPQFAFGFLTPIIFTAGIITMFRLAFEHSEIERQSPNGSHWPSSARNSRAPSTTHSVIR